MAERFDLSFSVSTYVTHTAHIHTFFDGALPAFFNENFSINFLHISSRYFPAMVTSNKKVPISYHPKLDGL